MQWFCVVSLAVFAQVVGAAGLGTCKVMDMDPILGGRDWIGKEGSKWRVD
jgi:hypothetical protein